MSRTKVGIFRKRVTKKEKIDVESLHSALIPTARSFWESLEQKSCNELREMLSQKWIPSHKEAIERVYKQKGC